MAKAINRIGDKTMIRLGIILAVGLMLAACEDPPHTVQQDGPQSGQKIATLAHHSLPQGAIILREYAGRNDDWVCVDMDGTLFLMRMAYRQSVLTVVETCPWMDKEVSTIKNAVPLMSTAKMVWDNQ